MSGLIFLVYGLTTGNVHGWDKTDVIATLVVAVALLAIFAFVELKVSSDPVLTRTSTICCAYIDRLDWIEADNTQLPK